MAFDDGVRPDIVMTARRAPANGRCLSRLHPRMQRSQTAAVRPLPLLQTAGIARGLNAIRQLKRWPPSKVRPLIWYAGNSPDGIDEKPIEQAKSIAIRDKTNVSRIAEELLRSWLSGSEAEAVTIAARRESAPLSSFRPIVYIYQRKSHFIESNLCPAS